MDGNQQGDESAGWLERCERCESDKVLRQLFGEYLCLDCRIEVVRDV